MATDTAAMTEAAKQILRLSEGRPIQFDIEALQALADNWLATVYNKDEYARIIGGKYGLCSRRSDTTFDCSECREIFINTSFRLELDEDTAFLICPRGHKLLPNFKGEGNHA